MEAPRRSSGWPAVIGRERGFLVFCPGRILTRLAICCILSSLSALLLTFLPSFPLIIFLFSICDKRTVHRNLFCGCVGRGTPFLVLFLLFSLILLAPSLTRLEETSKDPSGRNHSRQTLSTHVTGPGEILYFAGHLQSHVIHSFCVRLFIQLCPVAFVAPRAYRTPLVLLDFETKFFR